jgi:hypothetical protein
MSDSFFDRISGAFFNNIRLARLTSEEAYIPFTSTNWRTSKLGVEAAFATGKTSQKGKVLAATLN